MVLWYSFAFRLQHTIIVNRQGTLLDAISMKYTRTHLMYKKNAQKMNAWGITEH
jgi:hypothetical protein